MNMCHLGDILILTFRLAPIFDLSTHASALLWSKVEEWR